MARVRERNLVGSAVKMSQARGKLKDMTNKGEEM